MKNPEAGKRAKIICKNNGPYIVLGAEELVGKDGRSTEPEPDIALCRCGQSTIKPFCDGTHRKTGFSSATDYENRTTVRNDTYVGENLTIQDNRGLCAHAGVCTDNLSAVFRMRQEPWIDPEGAAADEIKSVIARCPSGALGYTEPSSGEEVAGDSGAAKIQVIPDGPYKLSGSIAFEDQELEQQSPRRARTLCRCGHSKNKPFCDGSHWDAGFKDS